MNFVPITIEITSATSVAARTWTTSASARCGCAELPAWRASSQRPHAAAAEAARLGKVAGGLRRA